MQHFFFFCFCFITSHSAFRSPDHQIDWFDSIPWSGSVHCSAHLHSAYFYGWIFIEKQIKDNINIQQPIHNHCQYCNILNPVVRNGTQHSLSMKWKYFFFFRSCFQNRLHLHKTMMRAVECILKIWTFEHSTNTRDERAKKKLNWTIK